MEWEILVKGLFWIVIVLGLASIFTYCTLQEQEIQKEIKMSLNDKQRCIGDCGDKFMTVKNIEKCISWCDLND